MSLCGKEGPFAFLFLQMFLFLLTVSAQPAQRRGQDPLCGQNLLAILTPAEQPLIDACQRFPDILNEFPIPVSHAQGDDPVQFDRCPVKGIGQPYVLVFHFHNGFVACPLQLIHLPEQGKLDILDLFLSHLSSILRHTYPLIAPRHPP